MTWPSSSVALLKTKFGAQHNTRPLRTVAVDFRLMPRRSCAVSAVSARRTMTTAYCCYLCEYALVRLQSPGWRTWCRLAATKSSACEDVIDCHWSATKASQPKDQPRQIRRTCCKCDAAGRQVTHSQVCLSNRNLGMPLATSLLGLLCGMCRLSRGRRTAFGIMGRNTLWLLGAHDFVFAA